MFLKRLIKNSKTKNIVMPHRGLEQLVDVQTFLNISGDKLSLFKNENVHRSLFDELTRIICHVNNYRLLRNRTICKLLLRVFCYVENHPNSNILKQTVI